MPNQRATEEYYKRQKKRTKNIAQIKAIDQKNLQRLLAVNPQLDDRSGIYFLTREDPETLIKYSYVGQAHHIRQRMLGHMRGFQHIDLSLKAHGLYSDENPGGWRIGFKCYPAWQLDEMERKYIIMYARSGYQSRNKDTGGGKGKSELGERKQPKTYTQGKVAGYRKASKEISNLFDKHLDWSKKSDKPNKNQDKAAEKFEAFLEFWKGDE